MSSFVDPLPTTMVVKVRPTTPPAPLIPPSLSYATASTFSSTSAWCQDLHNIKVYMRNKKNEPVSMFIERLVGNKNKYSLKW